MCRSCPICPVSLWVSLKSLVKRDPFQVLKWEAVTAAVAVAAYFQVPDWLGNRQAAYHEIRSQMDAAEASFAGDAGLQAFWVAVDPGSGTRDVRMRMSLALIAMTNDLPVRTLHQACTAPSAFEAQAVVTELGEDFLALTDDNMLLLDRFLFGPDHWHRSGKRRLRQAYAGAERYLNAFEVAWRNHEDDLVDEDDWRDWVAYLDSVRDHTLFQLAIHRNAAGFPRRFIEFVRNRPSP